jgi:precorrin-3B methylase
METAKLIVVGIGIKFGMQTTAEAVEAIKNAGKVFYILPEPLAGDWVKILNSTSESLDRFYEVGKPRAITYEEIVNEVMIGLNLIKDVCLVLYGHPGIFATPGHHAIRKARELGYKAKMIPGVSAVDCLFADLGIDPSRGCQEYEAMDLIQSRPRFTAETDLILWQISAIGRQEGRLDTAKDGLQILEQFLVFFYDLKHRVIIYKAATIPGDEPSIIESTVSTFAALEIDPMATMYIRGVSK